MPRGTRPRPAADGCLLGVAMLLAMTAAALATQQGAHAELAKGASRGSTGRALLQDAGGRAAQDLYANINQLVTALCQYESGASCDVDLNGTSSWWRTNFLQYPTLNVSTGMTPPVLNPGEFQILHNQTVGNLYCPWRPFHYRCQLDKQTYAASTTASTVSKAWSIGGTYTQSQSWGVGFLGTGFKAGYTLSISAAANWAYNQVNASMEQTTAVDSLQIDIYPQNSSCLYLSTYMQIVRANATQIAFISVSDYVGTSQSPAQSWPDPAWDDGNSNPHQYRAFSLPYALLWLKAQAAINNVTFSGLEYWTPNSQGTEARINMPITLQFDVGTNGWVQETYNLKDSDFCKQHDAQQARRRLRAAFNEPYADDEVVGHDYVDGRRVPIIKARRLA